MQGGNSLTARKIRRAFNGLEERDRVPSMTAARGLFVTGCLTIDHASEAGAWDDAIHWRALFERRCKPVEQAGTDKPDRLRFVFPPHGSPSSPGKPHGNA